MKGMRKNYEFVRLNEPDFSVQFCQLSLSPPLVLIASQNCKGNCKLLSISFNVFVSYSQKVINA